MAISPMTAGVAFVFGVFGILLGMWLKRKRKPGWPREWGITARPVFATHERAMHRLLTTTLPQHAVLAKLPLLRFCQSISPDQVPYWYDLLSPLYVSFAICSPNGRVLVAVDFEHESSSDSSAMKLKSAALQACRVRHVRCRANALPNAGEIMSWVGEVATPAQKAAAAEAARFEQAGAALAQTVRKRRAERQTQSQWQDSFFAPDSRFDDLLSTPANLDEPSAAPSTGSEQLSRS